MTAFKSQDEKITVFLIGDSTCANKLPADNPETGWGMVLPAYFNENSVTVQNHAVNGRSTKSFINENRWETVTKLLKKGDWVLIQAAGIVRTALALKGNGTLWGWGGNSTGLVGPSNVGSVSRCK